jgi:hypothetical protein
VLPLSGKRFIALPAAKVGIVPFVILCFGSFAAVDQLHKTKRTNCNLFVRINKNTNNSKKINLKKNRDLMFYDEIAQKSPFTVKEKEREREI